MRLAWLGPAALVLCACAGGQTTNPDDDGGTTPDSGTPADARADAPAADAPFDAPARCSNAVRDGAESDVDCGGGACPKCADGKACVAASDCAAGACSAGKCGARMWTEESSGANVAIPGNQTWVPANLTLTPTLYAASLVSLRWTGTLRFGSGGNGLCHVGQRFVIDGTPTGNATWGDAIMVMRGSSRWHESFTDEIAVPLMPGTHTISVEMTNANGYATCNLDGDGGAGYDHSRLAAAALDPQAAWYAESNGETGSLAANGPWTNVPGAFAAFTLASKQHVQMALTGTQLAQGAGSAHCAYRFVVDGQGLGDANHGQAISVGDVPGGWWAPVALKYGQDLMPGAHAVQAQVRNSSPAGGTCNAGQGNNAYARFRMLVTARDPGGSNVSAESSGGAYVLGSNSQWTAVGGLQTTFALAADTHVQLEMAATERTISGSGHCAWRFVVDNTPLGDPNHGQAINVGDGATTWWTATPLLWGQTFTAGMHTVGVEVRNSSTSGDCGTNGDGAAYGRARLLVRGP